MFANSFALPPTQALTIAVPDLFGNPKNPSAGYWGADFYEEYTVYNGVFPLLAVLLALSIAAKRREALFFLGLIALGFVMSLGLDGALMPILWRWIPGFTAFRTPGRALFFVMVGMAGLTGLLISTLQSASSDERKTLLNRWVRYGVPASAASLFIVAIVCAVLRGLYKSGETSAVRLDTVSASLTLTAFLLLGLTVLIYLWRSDGSQSVRWALILTCLFVIFDAWHVSLPLITVSPLRENLAWAGARINILTGPDARVTGPPGYENLASVTSHLNIAGYDPLPIEAYRKLLALGNAKDPENPVSRVLGVKYHISLEPYSNDNFKLIGIAEGGIYYQRKVPFPRAWIAQRIEVEQNDDAIRLNHILPGKEDMTVTAYVGRTIKCPSVGGSASVMEYRTNQITINTSGNGGLLVLSDQFYPGWIATVDGMRAPIIRTDTVFRGVCVAPGEHSVTFRYQPNSLVIGLAISIIGWIIWFGLMLFWFVLRHDRWLMAAREARQ